MNQQNLKDIRKLIDEYKNIALSDKDIENLVGGKANIVIYPDILRFNSINELLDPYGACFLLYESHPHYGHWCCIIKIEENNGGPQEIEFFDSYGGFPDSQLDFIPEPFKTESNQNVPWLSELLIKCNYDMSFNEFQFQQLDKGVKDCGRWCVLRVLLKDMPLKDFQELFYNMYSDDFATILTMDDSQKK